MHGNAPHLAIAPGRVNLIGEHTDYNEGFVLPMAIDRYVCVGFRARPDSRLAVHSMEFGGSHTVDANSIAPPSPTGARQWYDYVAGVAVALRTAGRPVLGADLVLHGNVPVGAGLSSSAALELAVALALTSVGGEPWHAVEMAYIARRAEHDYVGVQCGIMDQLTSAASVDGRALLVDCRTLETRLIGIPPTAQVVVMDTGARRALASSEYNDRRASCARAVDALRTIDPSVVALRDASLPLLAASRDRMDEVTYRRALHVIAECARPQALADAFAVNDLEAAGRLMNASHESLRDLYEVSSAELELACALAREHPACYGARLTGAGFGGCAIALVSRDGIDDFIAAVRPRYERRSKLRSTFFGCEPVGGARLLEDETKR